MANILIVDNSVDIRLALSALLEDGGYQASEAADGPEVMPALLESRPDVILLDVALPGKDGFEVLKEITADERTCDVPVIMVTAKGRPEDLAMARALGARDYISKPWTDGEVELRVSWVLQAIGRTTAAARTPHTHTDIS